MKSIISTLFGWIVILSFSISAAHSQTRIAKEQIEDAYLLKTGGALYGDLNAATSALNAATFGLETENGFLRIFKEGPNAVIRSNIDLYLDPSDNGAAGAKIIPVTMMEFPDFLGDKIHFYSHTYSIGVSPYNLDIRSDRNIKFHSDTSPDLMVIWGDQGDVQVKQDLLAGRDVLAGGVYKFSSDSEGDKLQLYGTLYRLAVSSQTLDFYSDNLFEWHTDTKSNVLQLSGDGGRLTLSGPLKLPVYSSLPGGETGDLIYFDHSTDNAQDGAYIRCATDWQKCN